MAPTGTVSVSVFRHKSHITQRNGHSLFVRKTVATGSTNPPAAHSSSTKYSYGREASRSSRAGRRLSIQASTVELMSRGKEISVGTPPHEREVATPVSFLKPLHAGSGACRTPAYRSR